MKVYNYTDDAAISKLIIYRANTRRSSRVQSPGLKNTALLQLLWRPKLHGQFRVQRVPLYESAVVSRGAQRPHCYGVLERARCVGIVAEAI